MSNDFQRTLRRLYRNPFQSRVEVTGNSSSVQGHRRRPFSSINSNHLKMNDLSDSKERPRLKSDSGYNESSEV